MLRISCIGAGFDLAYLLTGALTVFILLTGLVFLSLNKAKACSPTGRLKHWLRAAGLITYLYYLIHELSGGFLLRRAVDAGLGRPAGLAHALCAIGRGVDRAATLTRGLLSA